MFIKIINEILNKAEIVLSLLLRIIGPLFALGVTVFDFIIFISFFEITMPFIAKQISQLLSIVIAIIEVYLFLNLQLNFFLAMIVKPGSLKDIIQSKRHPIPYNDLDLSQILYNESNQIAPNELLSMPICLKCNSIKLLRSHHCSVCNQCVIKMDHHCPWINNCIGLNNHRYFLLFLSFAHLFLIYSMALGIWVYVYNDSNANKELYRVSMIINIVSLLMTSFFIMWQWIFALKGMTTIEYWMNKTGKHNKDDIIRDYSLYDWRDNLMIVFGTRSILRALFIPSIKRLGLIGCEWTQLVFKDYAINKTR